MTDISKLLKNAPKGLKLYSPIMGVCYLHKIDNITSEIYISFDGENINVFDKYGRYEATGECLLFPSETNRDWADYEARHNFKPFDKVVVRVSNTTSWKLDFFSHCDKKSIVFPFVCCGGAYDYCLPFNEETVKLIGTKDDWKE